MKIEYLIIDCNTGMSATFDTLNALKRFIKNTRRVIKESSGLTYLQGEDFDVYKITKEPIDIDKQK